MRKGGWLREGWRCWYMDEVVFKERVFLGLCLRKLLYLFMEDCISQV